MRQSGGQAATTSMDVSAVNSLVMDETAGSEVRMVSLPDAWAGAVIVSMSRASMAVTGLDFFMPVSWRSSAGWW